MRKGLKYRANIINGVDLRNTPPSFLCATVHSAYLLLILLFFSLSQTRPVQTSVRDTPLRKRCRAESQLASWPAGLGSRQSLHEQLTLRLDPPRSRPQFSGAQMPCLEIHSAHCTMIIMVSWWSLKSLPFPRELRCKFPVLLFSLDLCRLFLGLKTGQRQGKTHTLKPGKSGHDPLPLHQDSRFLALLCVPCRPKEIYVVIPLISSILANCTWQRSCSPSITCCITIESYLMNYA
jgi:hypothetical protein